MTPVGAGGPKAPHFLALVRWAESPCLIVKSEIKFHAVLADRPSRAFRSRLRLIRRARPGQGNAGPQTAAPARQSRRPETARQAGVRAGADADGSPGALDRLLFARLSRRGESAARRRRL